jgi:hypothetical protein
MKRILIIIFLTSALILQAQNVKDTIVDDKVLIEGDSIEFTLDEVYLFKKLHFKNKKERNYYYWFWKKVHKAYPYAMQTSKILNEIDTKLKKIKSKRKKKRFIRKAQKYLKEEFSGQLKKLTRTEGKILIKLIHRQTGKTVFDLIKEYRSGWKAFWYDSTARLFDLSLKKEYHPESDDFDFLIEDILQRAFSNESLVKQEPKKTVDYMYLSKKWKNIDIIKVIDNR